MPGDDLLAVGLRDDCLPPAASGADQHAGVSQARRAAATGIGQGRLNEIINGHRQVARLDVLERIAGGLAMPDDARVLFGLAPVHAETLTGHAEIGRVFTGQAEANAELREQAGSAARIGSNCEALTRSVRSSRSAAATF